MMGVWKWYKRLKMRRRMWTVRRSDLRELSVRRAMGLR